MQAVSQRQTLEMILFNGPLGLYGLIGQKVRASFAAGYGNTTVERILRMCGGAKAKKEKEQQLLAGSNHPSSITSPQRP